jgi:hypothetical protein
MRQGNQECLATCRERARRLFRDTALAAVGTALCVATAWAGLQDDRLSTDDMPRAGAAAAALIGASTPMQSAALLLQGQATSIWDVTSTTASKSADGLPFIDREILGGVEDRAPVRSADQNYYEARAYDYLLIQAHKASPEGLAKIARKDLTFAHLFEEPERYRGEVVHVEGRLRMLRQFPASRFAAKQGVPSLYEGWIFEDAYLGNPYCVIVTQLPASIQIGERTERRVAFDGYFLKRYRYKSQGEVVRDAPLLIGHSLLDVPPSVTASSSPWLLSDAFLPALLTILGATVAVVLGLSWWYMRGDRRVRMQLDKARQVAWIEPSLPIESQAKES